MGARGAKPKKSLPMETGDTLPPEIQPTRQYKWVIATDTDGQGSPPAPFSDPATKYGHHVNGKHVQVLKASEIGPDNFTVNTEH